MKKLPVLAVLSLFLALLSYGCGEKNTVRSPEGKELTLSQPANQTIKQGATNKIDIAIGRKNFADEVKIDFDNLPSGVSVAESERIAAGDTSRTFTLVAKDDAPLVERRTVKVEAKGGGVVVTQTFELSVHAK